MFSPSSFGSDVGGGVFQSFAAWPNAFSVEFATCRASPSFWWADSLPLSQLLSLLRLVLGLLLAACPGAVFDLGLDVLAGIFVSWRRSRSLSVAAVAGVHVAIDATALRTASRTDDEAAMGICREGECLQRTDFQSYHHDQNELRD